jgi:hypothetical protein
MQAVVYDSLNYYMTWGENTHELFEQRVQAILRFAET